MPSSTYPDSPPAEVDGDEALGGDRAVLRGERTERPHAGQSGHHRDAEAVLPLPSSAS